MRKQTDIPCIMEELEILGKTDTSKVIGNSSYLKEKNNNPVLVPRTLLHLFLLSELLSYDKKQLILDCFSAEGLSFEKLRQDYSKNQKRGLVTPEYKPYEDMILEIIDLFTMDSPSLIVFKEYYKNNYNADYIYLTKNENRIRDLNNKKSIFSYNLYGECYNLTEDDKNFIFNGATMVKNMENTLDLSRFSGFLLFTYLIDNGISAAYPGHFILSSNDLLQTSLREYNNKLHNMIKNCKIEWLADDEDFYQSKGYRKYIEHQKNNLIDYLKVENYDQVLDYFYNNINYMEINWTHPIAEHLAKYDMRSIDNIGLSGYTKDDIYTPKEFISDLLDTIFRDAIDNYIADRFVSDDIITKLDISRFDGISPETIVAMMQTNIAMEGIFADFQEIMKENYFYKLSPYKDINEKSERVWQQKYEELNLQYQNLIEKHQELKNNINSASDTSKLEKIHQSNLSEKEKEKSELLKEIEELKSRIAEKDEFIDQLQKEDNIISKTENIDLSVLYDKKLLFAGDVNTHNKDLRSAFPDAIIVDNENYSLVNIQCDAIVLFTKCLSHSLFHKVYNYAQNIGAKIIWYNSRNIDLLKQEIAKAFQ